MALVFEHTWVQYQGYDSAGPSRWDLQPRQSSSPVSFRLTTILEIKLNGEFDLLQAIIQLVMATDPTDSARLLCGLLEQPQNPLSKGQA